MRIKSLISQNLKNIYHLIQAILANFWFSFPSRKIKVIGITGTNGKTTTAQMATKILEETGNKVAMISTINFKLGEKEWVNKTKFTTLSSWATQKFIKQAVDAGCEYLILETSSHSLDQNRVWGVKYNIAVITNITREHLDYHKTMEKYRQAKLKLSKKAKNIVVNLEMEKPEEFILRDKSKMYGYGVEIPNSKSQILSKLKTQNSKLKTIIATDIELGNNYSNYRLQTTDYKLHLPGRFNIKNALAAICVGKIYGISDEIMARALEKIKGIPGRMESVPNNKGLNIIIDYAVTPDSLEKLYKLIDKIKKTLPLEKHARRLGGGNVRRTEGFERNNSFSNPPLSPFSKGGESKIISVLGACGERDRGKRPIMGEIVSRFADYVIITNEDPYNEDPARIINEVFFGVVDKNPKSEGVNAWRVLDRREAIKKALRIAKLGDFVVITGKGAEETMAVGKKRIPWNDKKVVMRILANK